MTSEVKKTLKDMKNNKAPGIDNLTSDIMILGREESVKQITQMFNQIIETKKIPAQWKEAKKIILHKKEMRETLKITGPSVYFSTCTNCSHRYYKKRMERVLDENQPREQAGFRKGYSTIDHLQTSNQLIEKCNEFKRPLCIGYIDYEKTFDSIELDWQYLRH